MESRNGSQKRHFIVLVFSGLQHYFVHTCMSYSGLWIFRSPRTYGRGMLRTQNVYGHLYEWMGGWITGSTPRMERMMDAKGSLLFTDPPLTRVENNVDIRAALDPRPRLIATHTPIINPILEPGHLATITVHFGSIIRFGLVGICLLLFFLVSTFYFQLLYLPDLGRRAKKSGWRRGYNIPSNKINK